MFVNIIIHWQDGGGELEFSAFTEAFSDETLHDFRPPSPDFGAVYKRMHHIGCGVKRQSLNHNNNNDLVFIPECYFVAADHKNICIL